MVSVIFAGLVHVVEITRRVLTLAKKIAVDLIFLAPVGQSKSFNMFAREWGPTT